MRKRYSFLMLFLCVLAVAGFLFVKAAHDNRGKNQSSTQASKAQKSSIKHSSRKVLFRDRLTGPNRIVTNEFVHFSSNDGCPYISSVWDMTSGTLLIKNGAGYSGVPTLEKKSICESATQNNSAIFRLNTKKSDFKNAKVSLDFMAVTHGGGGAPANSYDGIHIWVGYQDQYSLYTATIFRWDNTIVIKKKIPVAQAHCASPANDGCYYNVSGTPKNAEAASAWHHADVTTSTDASGFVHIAIDVDGKNITSGVDNNLGGAAYPSGAVGVRGDNTEFYFKNFTVTQL